jgi:hypothetical protein
MNHKPLEPADAKLRVLLRESRSEPNLPPGFATAVWHRIERAETPASKPVAASWLDRFVEGLLQPRLAMAGVALLLLAGGLSGVATGAGATRQLAQDRYLAAVAPNALH